MISCACRLAVLLGLTDDVDAAVVCAGISSDGRIAAEHVATVPALAYVAAGKVQRRAVLFGQPGELPLLPCTGGPGTSDCTTV